MLRFILNEQSIATDLPGGSTVLDFIRYQKRLMGTKIGCREGDCGACTVLVGSLTDGELHYQSMTSCLMPLGNAEGKHIVTVEGINLPDGKQGLKQLSPVQEAMVECNGTQCGFCTPGFVMSLTGFVLAPSSHAINAVAAIDGNICRCTGYKSIERAAAAITEQLSGKPAAGHIEWLATQGFIPSYFTGIAERLKEFHAEPKTTQVPFTAEMLIGGGTDLLVQKHGKVKQSSLDHVTDNPFLHGIGMENDRCRIGASVTVTQFVESVLLNKLIPNLPDYIKLVSSTPIRNMATIAGNLVNASPIGDMTVFLLALDASVLLNDGQSKRELKLKEFYLDYKKLDKRPGEWIEAIFFTPPSSNSRFNFEKVSKRTHLDIASVNSACLVSIDDKGSITDIHLSAGGVAPFPKYLSKTNEYLVGRRPDKETIEKAMNIMQAEVAPISDARGTKEYKRLLLRQLFFSHLVQMTDAGKAVKTVIAL